MLSDYHPSSFRECGRGGQLSARCMRPYLSLGYSGKCDFPLHRTRNDYLLASKSFPLSPSSSLDSEICFSGLIGIYHLLSSRFHLCNDVLNCLARIFCGYSFQCINRCDKSYSFTWFHCYSSLMPNGVPSSKVKSSNMLFEERPNIPSQANVTKTSSNSLSHNTEPIEK